MGAVMSNHTAVARETLTKHSKQFGKALSECFAQNDSLMPVDVELAVIRAYKRTPAIKDLGELREICRTIYTRCGFDDDGYTWLEGVKS